jgi:hypothetical protein
MALFKKLFPGLMQAADDDVNGLITVMIACLIDEGNYKSYRVWFTEQIQGNPATAIDTLGLGIFTDLTRQSADKERWGMRQAIDGVLWKIRQEETSL